MSLFWSEYGNTREPQGGERREWKDLQPGDLICVSRKVWSIVEARLVPSADWDERDREQYDLLRPVSEDEWERRPVYIIAVPADGDRRHHMKVCPYAFMWSRAWVLSPHYPVCRECGEPWPCTHLDISREVSDQSAELDRLSKILPGCCWSCGDPVTGRQSSIVFDGENLLLPGAPPPVFHTRRKGACGDAAYRYEQRWVAAAEGRPWRLQCPGELTRHVDGAECSEPSCPGASASHRSSSGHHFWRKTEDDGTVSYIPTWTDAARCLRCKDALARGANGAPGEVREVA